MVLTNRTCPAENTAALEQSDFWDGRIVTLISVFLHARNYFVPREQRQIIRILFMPAVYGVISVCSYRWFRDYTYYELIVVIYESIVLAAFLMLLLQYIGDSTDEQREVLLEKEKKKLMVPFCCWRYRPSKPYFLHALKWSVLQCKYGNETSRYVKVFLTENRALPLADSIFRPIISITGIICQALSVLCPTQYSIYYASVYLDSAFFVEAVCLCIADLISVALYGLILFYGLVKERLAGKKPLAKFLAIKGIVMSKSLPPPEVQHSALMPFGCPLVTFYQVFIFSVLQSHGVIKATEYWTAANVADGLAALCTCCEMVIFSAVFFWAFSWKPYRQARAPGQPHTSVFKALVHSFNYADFFQAGWHGIVFTIHYILGRPETRSSSMGKKEYPGFDIDNAFQSSSKRTINGRDGRAHSSSLGKKTIESRPFAPLRNREGGYEMQQGGRDRERAQNQDHQAVPTRQDSLPHWGQPGGRGVRETTLPLSPGAQQQQHQRQQPSNTAGSNNQGYVEYLTGH
ncbi:BQ2448_6569 [Microbotryum intermedium]|uniref:BQ2448_6569 protein n=1 Tax=Microbotryum intermedium TaxID=269621 RepID=A0A238FLK6_9BASI|nr:BQ2448_6569 [Microbotryum intermedium]